MQDITYMMLLVEEFMGCMTFQLHYAVVREDLSKGKVVMECDVTRRVRIKTKV